MTDVLGTIYELSMRYLVALFAAEKTAMSVERLCALDFIATYGADFGLTDANLHGRGGYRYGEYASRSSMAESAMKRLVINGYVTVIASDHGYAYAISPQGITLCNQLESSYSDSYYCVMRIAISHFDKYSDSEVGRTILDNASSVIEGE